MTFGLSREHHLFARGTRTSNPDAPLIAGPPRSAAPRESCPPFYHSGAGQRSDSLAEVSACALRGPATTEIDSPHFRRRVGIWELDWSVPWSPWPTEAIAPFVSPVTVT